MSSTINPVTVVTPATAIPLDEMVQRVRDSHDKHGATLQKYHEIWYEAGHTWVFTHFLGIGLMKCPNDLWAYQALMASHRPRTVIETGTYGGGAALWFAYLMDMLRIDDGRVYTIDYQDMRQCGHPRITFVQGDSADPEVARPILEAIEYPLLISLDSDHSAAHVYNELHLYAPYARVNDWIVVEDTNVSWSGEGGDLGAAGGLSRYLEEHPDEFRQDLLSERWLLTMAPGGWLQRISNGPR